MERAAGEEPARRRGFLTPAPRGKLSRGGIDPRGSALPWFDRAGPTPARGDVAIGRLPPRPRRGLRNPGPALIAVCRRGRWHIEWSHVVSAFAADFAERIFSLVAPRTLPGRGVGAQAGANQRGTLFVRGPRAVRGFEHC